MILFPNFWSVLVAAAICFVAGGLWFSPPFFGNTWIKELDANPKQLNPAAGALLAIPASVIAALGMGVLVASSHVSSVYGGIGIALIVWLAFAVAIHLPAAYLEQAPKRFLIDTGHKLLVYMLMGAILGVWH